MWVTPKYGNGEPNVVTTQAPNHPSGLVAPYPRSCVNQSERFRAMPSVIMSTMNLSFAQPAGLVAQT